MPHEYPKVIALPPIEVDGRALSLEVSVFGGWDGSGFVDREQSTELIDKYIDVLRKS